MVVSFKFSRTKPRMPLKQQEEKISGKQKQVQKKELENDADNLKGHRRHVSAIIKKMCLLHML